MKNYLFIIIFVFMQIFESCSNVVQVIECKPQYGINVTSGNLALFKDKKVINIKSINNKDLKIELDNIKRKTLRENIVPTTILYYAFISQKDTLYASSNLKYWLYKGKVQLYESNVVNERTIDSILIK